MTIKLEDYFKYHPPTTEERKRKHDLINSAALAFAQVLDYEVEDEECKKMAFYAIQQARMFANQGIVIDELKIAEQVSEKVLKSKELDLFNEKLFAATTEEERKQVIRDEMLRTKEKVSGRWQKSENFINQYHIDENLNIRTNKQEPLRPDQTTGFGFGESWDYVSSSALEREEGLYDIMRKCPKPNAKYMSHTKKQDEDAEGESINQEDLEPVHVTEYRGGKEVSKGIRHYPRSYLNQFVDESESIPTWKNWLNNSLFWQQLVRFFGG